MVSNGVDPLGWIGSTLESKYGIDAFVGEGGFGCVYRGRHLALGKPIAVKFLKPELAVGTRRDRVLQAFLDEGRLLHDLSRATAGVVQALDLGSAVSRRGEWTLFIVMEWLEGRTLAAELEACPRRSVREAVAVLDPVLDALATAHEMGIAHRDLKPSNLMLARVGTRQMTKVLDFGIAKVMGDIREPSGAFTRPGTTRMFSPAYAAPEQFDPTLGASGPWTDVYALGLILIEVVDGTHGHRGEGLVECQARAVDLEHRPGLASDRSLDAVLRRALAVDPRNRFSSAAEFRDAIHEALAPPSEQKTAKPRVATEVPVAPVPAATITAARSSDGAATPPTVVATMKAAPLEVATPNQKSSVPAWPFVGVVVGIVAVVGYFGANALIASVQRTPAFATQPEVPAPPSPDADIREAVRKWDDAESAHDVTKLQAMYSDRVCFYHADHSPAQVANSLHGLYASDPGFKQSIDPSSINLLHRAPSGWVRVEFNKSFTSKGRTSTTHAYLVFDAGKKIIVEGDDVTDANMRNVPTLGRCATAETW